MDGGFQDFDFLFFGDFLRAAGEESITGCRTPSLENKRRLCCRVFNTKNNRAAFFIAPPRPPPTNIKERRQRRD